MGKFFNRRKDDAKAARDEFSPQELIELVAQRAPEAAPCDDPDFDLSIPDCPEMDDTNSAPHAGITPPQSQPPSLPKEAGIYTFLGASGGVGTTCLATQIAHELAVQCQTKNRLSLHPHDPQVCLIDLDFETGTCAHHLDLVPSLSLDDISGDAGRIDQAFTTALISTHKSGVSLLATPQIFGASQKVNPNAIMAILDAASKLYRYVIVDMPRTQQPWSMAVMGGSDMVGVVAELSIPSLHLAKARMQHAEKTLGERVNMQPIISKYERRSFRNTLRLSDAEAALGQSVWGTVCFDPDTTREAINCGEPVGASRKDSRYAKDSRILVNKLLTEQVEDVVQTRESSAA